MFARARFGLSEILSFAGKARLGHLHASAAGVFRTTLAAVTYFIEALHSEGGEGDQVGVTFIMAGQPDPADFSPPALPCLAQPQPNDLAARDA